MAPLLLLAMQASGMVVDWLGRNQQIQFSRMGQQLEQQGIESNIQLSRLQSEQGSLMAMHQLRQNLGTQAAMLAARGTRGNAGNAVLLRNESLGNFNADERIRKINQLSSEARYRAGMLTSQLQEKTFENKTWNEFYSNAFNKIGTNSALKDIFGK